MHRSRPAWLNDRISKAFTLESSPHFEGHKEVSSDEYQFGDITGAGIVQWQLARIGRCRLLDAGAGEGRFLLRRLWDWHALQPVLGFFDGQEGTLPYDMDDVMAEVGDTPMLVYQQTYDRANNAKEVAAAVCLVVKAGKLDGSC